jgi:hypothetical protein
MAKFSATSLLFLIDGYDFLAAKLKGLSLKISSITEQADGLGDPSKIFLPCREAESGADSRAARSSTPRSNSIHDAMASKLGTTPQATPRVGCRRRSWGTPSAPSSTACRARSAWRTKRSLDLGKLTKANAEHLMAGLVERGQIVQPLAAKTVDWNTKTLGTTVDFTTDPSQTTIPITSNSLANPSVVTTPVPHGLTTGQIILISGRRDVDPTINGERGHGHQRRRRSRCPSTTCTVRRHGRLVRAEQHRKRRRRVSAGQRPSRASAASSARFGTPPTTRPTPTWRRSPT